MKPLVWTPGFLRAFRRVVARNKTLRVRVERTLERLAQNPFQASLPSHKLKGELDGVWNCAVDYDCRILFEIVANRESGEEEVLLLTMGTHDEVY